MMVRWNRSSTRLLLTTIVSSKPSSPSRAAERDRDVGVVVDYERVVDGLVDVGLDESGVSAAYDYLSEVELVGAGECGSPAAGCSGRVVSGSARTCR